MNYQSKTQNQTIHTLKNKTRMLEELGPCLLKGMMICSMK